MITKKIQKLKLYTWIDLSMNQKSWWKIIKGSKLIEIFYKYYNLIWGIYSSVGNE
jgi:hypothetical protein